MGKFKLKVTPIVIVLLIFTSLNNSFGQTLSEGWEVRKIRDKETLRAESAYRNKINFFFGNYWNTSFNKLKKLKIAVKNYNASGKKSKAQKLKQSSSYQLYHDLDLEERAYIAHEYGLFSVDYAASKGVENLNSKEKIFIHTAIFRSLSGPIANRVGYKNLLKTEDGQERLKGLLTKVIDSHQSKSEGETALKSPKLDKELKEKLDMTGKSNEEVIASFCSAAISTFEKYAQKNKEMRDLMGGENWGKTKREDNELVKMSCADKRIIVYKMIAQVSR